MSFIYTALVVADIAALKALDEDSDPKRVDGVFLAVGDRGDGIPAWYRYNAASTATESLPDVVSPTDTTGRWFQFSGGGEGGASFGGQTICTSGCAIGGKAFAFFAPQTDLELNVQVGFDVSITSGVKSIQVHRWSQEPNTGLTGRVFAAELPHTGGTVKINLTSTYRWISIFAKNPSKSGAFDGVCFSVNGNTCTLIGYS